MIFIRKDGSREEREVHIEVGYLYLPQRYTIDESKPAGLYPVLVSTEFDLHLTGPNYFVYLERGASLDLLKKEPRV